MADINTAAGLALHPGTLEPFEKKLADGPGAQALAASKKAFEVCQGSIGDMYAARDAAPRVLQAGKTDILEDAKPGLGDAMARSFERGAANLESAERIIEETHKVLTQRIDAALIHPRRNETSVAAMHTQIRDVVRDMKPIDRNGFVRTAILEGDQDVASAVLSASPYASGLSKAQQADLRIDAEMKFSPEAFKTRADLEGLREQVTRASANYLAKYIDAVPRENPATAKRSATLKKLRGES